MGTIKISQQVYFSLLLDITIERMKAPDTDVEAFLENISIEQNMIQRGFR